MNSKDHFPFAVRPLPYPAKSLAPFLNARTVKIHHDGHYAMHIEKLNRILESFPKYHSLPLDALIMKQAFLPHEIRNEVKLHAGGALNHMLFFECLAPASKSSISGSFKKLLSDSFASFENFKDLMKKAALSLKGGGSAYLASDRDGRFHILALNDFETPIEHCLNPILPIDMWEHSYYLQYQYHRREYINNIFNIINWQRAEMNYFSA